MRIAILTILTVSACAADEGTDNRRFPTMSGGGVEPSAVDGMAGAVAPDPVIPEPCTLEGSVDVKNSLDWQQLVNSGCDTLNGALNIYGADITGLTESPLVLIRDDLIVASSNQLTSLAGLERLTDVLSVRISRNKVLTSLAGLRNLTTVRAAVFVQDNPVLTELGMDALRSVGDHVDIQRNPMLPAGCAQDLVAGLDAPQGGDLRTEGNAGGVCR